MPELTRAEGRGARWLWGAAALLVAAALLLSAIRLTAEPAKAAPVPAAKAEPPKAPAPAPAKAPAPAPQGPMQQQLAGQFDLMRGMLKLLEDNQAKQGVDTQGLFGLMDQAMRLQQQQLLQLGPVPGAMPPARIGPGAGFGPRPLPGRFGPGARFGARPGMQAAAAQANFHASSQQGNLTIDVTGTVANGVVTVDHIDVQDGGQALQFNSLDQVPAAYQEQVRGVIERASRGRAAGGGAVP
jgi:hypothetical protein